MGISTIGAVGVALPPPQALFPATIANQPGGAVGTNRISLSPGADFLLPSGTWLISPGLYSQVQVLDPVSNNWLPYTTQTVNEAISINSDGVNYRIMNPTGFAIGAIVTNAGTGYTSAPTVAAATGGSTWLAIVGGGIGSINIAAGLSGTGYSALPVVNIAAPPTPGVQATAVALLSGTVITGFTIINPGAGYSPSTNVAVAIVPQNGDQNFFPATGVTPPTTRNTTASASTSFVGQVTAVLMTNEGINQLNAAPALTFTGGGGSAAAATAVMAFTVTGWSVTTAGSTLANVNATVMLQTGGGAIQALTSGLPAASNSVALGANLLVPRMAQIVAANSGQTVSALTGGALSASSGILDGGLFTTPPTLYVPGYNGVYAAVVGGATDTVFVTPL